MPLNRPTKSRIRDISRNQLRTRGNWLRPWGPAHKKKITFQPSICNLYPKPEGNGFRGFGILIACKNEKSLVRGDSCLHNFLPRIQFFSKYRPCIPNLSIWNLSFMRKFYFSTPLCAHLQKVAKQTKTRWISSFF